MNWSSTATWDFAVLGFGGLFCLVWAGGLLLTRHGSVHYAGIALVFISGLRLVWEAFFLSGGALQASLVFGLFPPWMYAIGPIIFLYYRALAGLPFRLRDVGHFLIMLPAALPIILWLAANEPERINLLTYLRTGVPEQRSFADWLLLTWVLGPKLSILFYSILIPLHRAGEAMVAAASLRGNIKWFARGLLAYIWMMILFDIAGYILGIPAMFRMSAWSQAIAAILVYFYSRVEPGALLEFEKALAHTRYARSKLEHVDVQAALTRLEHLMKSERFYADEDLRLQGLADACRLSSHQVSEILNEKLGLSFSSFVNKHRIAAAADLLREEPDRSILSIAMAVGFNSKSAFNRAFHRFEGQTPSEFRRKS